jgi:hypothetical protein
MVNIKVTLFKVGRGDILKVVVNIKVTLFMVGQRDNVIWFNDNHQGNFIQGRAKK